MKNVDLKLRDVYHMLATPYHRKNVRKFLLVYGSSVALNGVQMKIGEKFKAIAQVISYIRSNLKKLQTFTG